MSSPDVDLNLYENVKEFTKEGGLSGAAKGAAIGAGSGIIFNTGAVIAYGIAGASTAGAIMFSAPAIAGLAAAGALYGVFKKKH